VTYVELPPEWTHLNTLNVFSAGYLTAVTEWLEAVTGRAESDPARDELANYLETPEASGDTPFVPGIYRYGSSAFLGDMIQAFGTVLKVLDVRAGQSVLEYGPGDGQIFPGARTNGMLGYGGGHRGAISRNRIARFSKTAMYWSAFRRWLSQPLSSRLGERPRCLPRRGIGE
jgi:hypothetical protein